MTGELRPGITACIAAHPARFRNGLLHRAVNSVMAQTLQPDAIVIGNDCEGHGAGWNRRQILNQVQTTRFAWCDSDDEWYPNHLEDLTRVMDETGAKYVFSYFDPPSSDPLGHFGRPFNPCQPHHTTITALVDTALALEVGFQDNADGPFANEDWAFILGFSALCCERGYKMVHLAKRTWIYHQGAGQNSSGQPGKGDAQW